MLILQSPLFPGRALLFWCVVCLVYGCSSAKSDKWEEQRPERVPVSATFRYKGQPVEKAVIVASPVVGKHAGRAFTNSDGVARFGTFEERDGLVPGSYKLTVQKMEVASELQESVGLSDEEQDAATRVVFKKQQSVLLPGIYLNSATTPLSIDVTSSGDQDFELELTD